MTKRDSICLSHGMVPYETSGLDGSTSAGGRRRRVYKISMIIVKRSRPRNSWTSLKKSEDRTKSRVQRTY